MRGRGEEGLSSKRKRRSGAGEIVARAKELPIRWRWTTAREIFDFPGTSRRFGATADEGKGPLTPTLSPSEGEREKAVALGRFRGAMGERAVVADGFGVWFSTSCFLFSIF